MALLYTEGFTYDRGLYTNFALSSTRGTGRNNGIDTAGLFVDDGFVRSGVNLPFASIGVGTLPTLITGFAIFASNPLTVGQHQQICKFAGNSNTHLTFDLDCTTRKVRAYFGPGSTTLLGTSTVPIFAAPGEWSYIEIKVTIDDTAGAIEVRYYGTTVLSLSGIDTRNADVAGVTNMLLGYQGGASGGSGMSFNYDDWYILDTTGATNNTFLATTSNNPRMIDFGPSAAGDSTQFTPSSGANYAAAASWDADTSYVGDPTVGQRDLYQFTDLPAGVANIAAVVLSHQARKDDATARSMAIGVKSGGTIYDQASFALTNAYVNRFNILDTDPATSAAWTAAGVNAMQAGPTVAA